MTFSSYITVLLVLVVAIGGWNYLERVEENEVVNILAPREADLGLPIFAQFVAVQRVTLDRPAAIKKVVVPVYFPAQNEALSVGILKGGESVDEWRFSARELGHVEAELVLDLPVFLDGMIEIRFAAEDIGHDKKDLAPRIFVDMEDRQYPTGNYRIAENEKEGDISVRLIEERLLRDRLLVAWEKRPLKVMYWVGLLLVGVLVLSALPGTRGRLLFGNNKE